MSVILRASVAAGFGMMGVEVAELALSWRRMHHRDRLLTNIVSFFLLMSLFAFTLNGGSIDQLGHLGGFLCGKLCALPLLFFWGWCLGAACCFFFIQKRHRVLLLLRRRGVPWVPV